MSSVNKLSEKDELIKSLREKQTDNKELNKSIAKKINVLDNNKTIEK